jgi:hypothetical protein
MPDWEKNWNILSHRYLQLEDTMKEVDLVLRDREASSIKRAEALIRGANHLCEVLGEYERLGVFKDIFEHASQAAPQHRQLVLDDLEKVLRLEEQVLLKANFDPKHIQEILNELREARSTQATPTPLDPSVWQSRLTEARSRICSFPKSEVLILAEDFGRFVGRVFAGRRIIQAAIVGAMNIAFASQFPEPALTKSVSTFLASLVIGALPEAKQ